MPFDRPAAAARGRLPCHNNPTIASFFGPVANRHSLAVFKVKSGHWGFCFLFIQKRMFLCKIFFTPQMEIIR
jgi:hypothetical protein